MAEDSFDDQYIGCSDKMESLASELLRKERRRTPELDEAWKYSFALWQKRKSAIRRLPDGFKDEYGIALLIPTMMRHNTVSVLDLLISDVMSYGRDPESFRFHALHFYMTRAMTLLRPGCDGKPLTVFSIENGLIPPLLPLAPVRIRFPYAASNKIQQNWEAEDISQFISTCFGLVFLNFSFHPMDGEVLIPMNEVFHVTSYDEKRNKITLQSTNRKCSYYNCAYLGGKKRENCIYDPLTSGVMELRAMLTAPLLVIKFIAIIVAPCPPSFG
ncbi:ecto-ADP-ribosyltransferase 5-like [Leptodactylus fuscus]|uniref:ecto-ADP-ribosyltransferase 5-like n=1 Tax=Leptodactylus fuscus TaxID=238119 RepID=UPI003F4EE4AA